MRVRTVMPSLIVTLLVGTRPLLDCVDVPLPLAAAPCEDDPAAFGAASPFVAIGVFLHSHLHEDDVQNCPL